MNNNSYFKFKIKKGCSEFFVSFVEAMAVSKKSPNMGFSHSGNSMLFSNEFQWLTNNVIEIFENEIIGIYFLIKEKEVVYVGQTNNFFVRPFSHKKDPISPKDYDRVFVIKAPKCLLDFLESAFIGLFLPFYNGGQRARKTSLAKKYHVKDELPFQNPLEALIFCVNEIDRGVLNNKHYYIHKAFRDYIADIRKQKSRPECLPRNNDDRWRAVSIAQTKRWELFRKRKALEAACP